MNLANGLTLLRLLLVPFIIQTLLDGRHTLALGLFLFAAVTDVLDGAAARRLKLATQTGAYLDPIADKTLLSGIFLALASIGMVPWWFVALVFGRDLYILAGVAAFMLLTDIRKFPPSIWGKYSTFVQIVTVVFCLFQNVIQSRLLAAIWPAILWLSVGFTAWSGIHYTWRGVQTVRAR